jgi:exonuclease VII small subunit
MSTFSLEQILENKDGKTVTVSLTAANKFMTKLKTHQSSEKETEDTWGSSRRSKSRASNAVQAKTSVKKILMKNCEKNDTGIHLNHTERTEINDSIADQTKSVVNAYTQNKRIFWDITTIKNKIFYTNGLKGIDTILSKIELLNSMKSELSTINKSLEGKHDLDILLKLYNRSVDDHVDITVDSFDKDDVNKTIKKINQMINELETERDKLNATTDITVFLSTESLEILGL